MGAGPVHGKSSVIWVGWSAILIGLVGVILHLESYFFLEHTIRSLTYSAPFAAPLACTGLGFLLIMNRMVDPNSPEWAQWIVLFTLGGFFGNFVFSLTDHAEDGFFNPLEWMPIYASAIAVGFLAVPLVMRVSSRFIDSCGLLLLLEAAVGLWGVCLAFRAKHARPFHAPLRQPRLPRSSHGPTSLPESHGPWRHRSLATAFQLRLSPISRFNTHRSQCTGGRLVCAAGQKRKT